MPDRNYFVYILTNKNLTTFYVGMTSNLEGRLYQHKEKLVNGFSAKYNLNRLVYYEKTGDVNSAIARKNN